MPWKLIKDQDQGIKRFPGQSQKAFLPLRRLIGPRMEPRIIKKEPNFGGPLKIIPPNLSFKSPNFPNGKNGKKFC